MPWETDHYTWISAATDIGIVTVVFALAWVLSRLIARGLYRLTRHTGNDFDDLVVQRVARLVPWFAAAVAAFVTIRIGPGTPALVAAVDTGIKVVLVVRSTMVIATLLAGMLEKKVLPLGSVGATTLTRNLVFWAVLAAGLVVALSQLGVEITPVLAALGVGSLALGLALQPTLTNVFAGFNLSLGQRLRVGDLVRLESGQEGEIVDIGWRSTEIRAATDNVILVPNAKLAELIVVNFSFPLSELAVPIDFAVGYGSDLAHVERVLLEVGREVIARVPGAVVGFEPTVRFKSFGESSIPLSCVLRAHTYTDRVALIDAFVRRVHVRFAEEGIEFPHPQRVVRLVGNAAAVSPPGAEA